MAEISKLVVGMAKSNPRWGYTRIRGTLSNLGHTVARSTIANILREHSIEPAPERSERTRRVQKYKRVAKPLMVRLSMRMNSVTARARS